MIMFKYPKVGSSNYLESVYYIMHTIASATMATVCFTDSIIVLQIRVLCVLTELCNSQPLISTGLVLVYYAGMSINC